MNILSKPTADRMHQWRAAVLQIIENVYVTEFETGDFLAIK